MRISFKLSLLLGVILLLNLPFMCFAQSKLCESDLFNYYNYDNSRIDTIMKKLSVEEKISQLLMVATYSNKTDAEKLKIEKLIKDYKIGGLIFFQGTSSKQIELTKNYQNKSKTPLLIGIDGENGIGSRLSDMEKYPLLMTLGAVDDNSLIFRLGKQMGEECKAAGIHINFAPVVDINSNKYNPVINYRSFGSNRYRVTRKSIAMIQGIQSNNVIAVSKHFPGHGDTDTDSHHALPLLRHNISRLDSLELFPYWHMGKNSPYGVMVGHLSVPALDSSALSASLSKPIVTDLLKGRMDFKGLVVTDALNMRGVSGHYKPGIVDRKAFEAGNDILLFVQDVPKAISNIKNLVQSDSSAMQSLNERCKKIIKTKLWLGLYDSKIEIEPSDVKKINSEKANILKQKLYNKAITVVKNKSDFLPLKRLDTLKIASVCIGTKTTTVMQKYMSKFTKIANFNISRDASDSKIDELLSKLKPYNLVIVSKHNTDLRLSRRYGVTGQSIKIFDKISARKKVVFDLFANPYALLYFRHNDNVLGSLVSYEDNQFAQKASAHVIFGGLSASGQLPIDVSTEFYEGLGIRTSKSRLGFSRPELQNMNVQVLGKIDSIANDAIAQKAFPGCVVLVAKKGDVVYHKAFGKTKYKSGERLTTNHIFDLASLTKVCVTTPLVMKAVQNKELSLSDSIVEYFPQYFDSDKQDIQVKELLAHQSGLKSWIPFVNNIVDSSSFKGRMYYWKKTKSFSTKLDDKLYVNNTCKFKKGVFRTKMDSTHSRRVGSKLYVNNSYSDSIVKYIFESERRSEKDYRYSDLGFILLGELMQKLYSKSLDNAIKDNFYKRLNCPSLTYNPKEFYDDKLIVPTQQENFMRKELLKGYVHDPSCVIMGGIAGHAGLFGNAIDLAKLMQMYMQNGKYGGEEFIKAKTLKEFTSQAFSDSDNRRGLGFDRIVQDTDDLSLMSHCLSASDVSYGHTGFTGTMVWVDPRYDFIYIFLSNRIHPYESNPKLNEMNIRSKIQQVIYDSNFTERQKPFENYQTYNPILDYLFNLN
ncbi:MAG: serine hydrolase [Marinifilaceae bacterium]|nr:serine hydrolase [Marinifilaceae bacterium]